MRFSNWLLSEMSWHEFPQTDINGIVADKIDFRFEDWKRGGRKDPSSFPPTHWESFSAPLNNGQWLNITRPSFKDDADLTYDQWKELRNRRTSVVPSAETFVSTKPSHNPIRQDWFDFAVLYMQNKQVKNPLWPRDNDAQATLGNF